MKKITITVLFLGIFGGLHAQTSPSISDMQKKMQELQKQLFENLGDTDLADKGLKLDTSFFFKIDTSFQGEDFFNFSIPFGDQAMPNNLDEMFQGFGDLSKLFKQFGFLGMDEENDMPKDDGILRDKNEDELLPEEKLRDNEKKPENPTTPVPEKAKKPTNKRKTAKL